MIHGSYVRALCLRKTVAKDLLATPYKPETSFHISCRSELVCVYMYTILCELLFPWFLLVCQVLHVLPVRFDLFTDDILVFNKPNGIPSFGKSPFSFSLYQRYWCDYRFFDGLNLCTWCRHGRRMCVI